MQDRHSHEERHDRGALRGAGGRAGRAHLHQRKAAPARGHAVGNDVRPEQARVVLQLRARRHVHVHREQLLARHERAVTCRA